MNQQNLHDVQNFTVYIKKSVLEDRGYDSTQNTVRVQCVREQSPCFTYGNETAVTMETWEADGFHQKHYYDTRYETGCNSSESFVKFAYDLVAGYYGDNAERIEQW